MCWSKYLIKKHIFDFHKYFGCFTNFGCWANFELLKKAIISGFYREFRKPSFLYIERDFGPFDSIFF